MTRSNNKSVRHGLILVLAVAFVLITGSCSDSDGGDASQDVGEGADATDDAADDADATVEDRAAMEADAGEFCDDLLRLICAHFTACLPEDLEFYCDEGGGAVEIGDRCSEAAAAVGRGALDFHSDEADACQSSFDTVSCDIYIPFYEDGCADVFSSNGGTGDECGWGMRPGWEGCAEGFFCDQGLNSDSCPGSCQPGRENGDECGDHSQCASGACNRPNGVCDDPPVEGELCFGVCQPGLACLFNRDSQLPVCAIERDEGETCDFQGQCPDGLTCTTGTCRQVAAGGEVCLTHENCPINFRCRADDLDGLTCQPMIPIGDPCVQDDGDQCADEGLCIEQAPFDGSIWECLAAPEEDDPCVGAQCNWPLVCVFVSEELGSLCRSQLQEGDACDLDYCERPLTCLANVPDGPRFCRGPGTLGETCQPRRTGVTCAQDLQCEFSSDTCQPPSNLGETCNWWADLDDSCEEEAFCQCTNCEDETDVEAFDAECVPRLGAGEPCQRDRHCIDGLGCEEFDDTESSRCVEPPDVDPNAACRL